jgi:hypothetical protein
VVGHEGICATTCIGFFNERAVSMPSGITFLTMSIEVCAAKYDGS